MTRASPITTSSNRARSSCPMRRCDKTERANHEARLDAVENGLVKATRDAMLVADRWVLVRAVLLMVCRLCRLQLNSFDKDEVAE